MRDYEATIIIQPQLEENHRDQLIGRIGDLMIPNSGEDDKLEFDIWGLRRLAYPIRDYREGFYIFYSGELEPSRIREIEQGLQYMEDVLRYMFVRKEG